MYISVPQPSQVSLFGSHLITPCQDNLPLITHSPLYQFPTTRLFGYIPSNHLVPHLTIRGPIPIRC